MHQAPHPSRTRLASARWVRALLLVLWALASFGVAFFARDLQQVVAGWPLNFWLAAQGGVLVFLGIVMFYAWFMSRAEPPGDASEHAADDAEA
ncbi:MAG: DUF4212 domain-containing protein [Pseudomonadota bacterium]|nr:DUF4212 domain-containing protein [Pseudomonadota bacterium]